MGDKYAIQKIASAAIIPDHLASKIEAILTIIDKYKLSESTAMLKSLFDEVVLLKNGLYKPYIEL